MNHLKLSLVACTLMLALALPAFAGEMQTPIAPPPPPPTGNTTSMAATGEISFPGLSADPVMEIALSLAQSVLALF